MTPEEVIAVYLREFAQDFVANRQRAIINQKLINTDELLRSLYAKVQSDGARGIHFMTVFGNIYGRWQDMARHYTRAGGKEMVTDLMQWIEKEGLSKFGNKLPDSLEGRSAEQIERGIAWGIIKKMNKGQPTKKRGWWNKGKTADINHFYGVLLRAYSEATAIQLKEAFQ